MTSRPTAHEPSHAHSRDSDACVLRSPGARTELLVGQDRQCDRGEHPTNARIGSTAARGPEAEARSPQDGTGEHQDATDLEHGGDLGDRSDHLVPEQQTIDLQLQLEERTQDLDAARAANRALMTQINATTTP
jgi:hypothetical protein